VSEYAICDLDEKKYAGVPRLKGCVFIGVIKDAKNGDESKKVENDFILENVSGHDDRAEETRRDLKHLKKL